ncbi:phosphate/phosphite/phosphonate ABC transporter substrate-binding protein [Luteimonas deserti]|uniref:Phosphate/phosphite/phosphonate ABC transporter substrate-binding protein n=1 Tax=Luteimonas deserti TaxID=2752306 RepID=A0A7Z0TY90_9GAMM|nr:phosphate/phosphite/phosphonate ABC transporter substrate-binding protein [Luteimonas deserti]NYZ62675.1 phosphate/phosphite/phosphonate ABC transporter substrate-binding protein [Luteimonas deserti]
MTLRTSCRWLLLGFVLVASVVASPAWSTPGSHVLVLGRVSDDPKAHYGQLKPLLDYVVARMGDVGITEGRVLMARDTHQMQSYLRRGRVDWVTETAGSAMLLEARGGARPMLLTERSGVSRYHTIYFARRDSGISSLDDLRGRSVAFQNRQSTSAYIVPAAQLLERGLSLDILLSPHDAAEPASVGYLFARAEVNTASWVHKRLVDVGVLSNIDWDNPRRVPASFKRDMAIFARSPEFPRALELVRGDLPPRVAARLREVLLEAGTDPAAANALASFFGTTAFLPVDPRTRGELDRLRAGALRVAAEVE